MSLDKKKGTKPATRQGTKQATKQGLLLVAAAGGLVAIVVVGVIVVVALRSGSSRGAGDASAAPRLTSQAGGRTATERRLALEEEPSDDAARADVFKRLLKDEGHPCSEIEKAAMISSGIWTVRCAPGHVYRLKFNQKARLMEATKLQ